MEPLYNFLYYIWITRKISEGNKKTKGTCISKADPHRSRPGSHSS